MTGKYQKKKKSPIFDYPQNVDNNINFPQRIRSQHILFIFQRKVITEMYKTQIGFAHFFN